MGVCVVIIGMSKTHFFGVELTAGSTLPDNLFMLCGCLIGGMGGMLQSASRSLMVRHAMPGKKRLNSAFMAYRVGPQHSWHHC
jgi:UMF1 family MFS transporter